MDPIFEDIRGGLTTGGSANAYTLTTNQAFMAYYQGLWIKAKVSFSNTGAATLNVNGIGAASIKNALGNDPAAGQIASGIIYDFVYNGSFFIALASSPLTVNSSGAVVIGAPTAQAPLHVRTRDGTESNLLFLPPDAFTTGVRIAAVNDAINAYEPLEIDSSKTNFVSGSVGIGTITPTSLLSVNGSADKVGGGSWGTFSDIRLKDISGSYTAGLSAILALSPIRYRYKVGNEGGVQADGTEFIGLVAQAVSPHIPDAVTETEAGWLQLNNDPIIFAMLNAIKELSSKFDALSTDFETYKASHP